LDPRAIIKTTKRSRFGTLGALSVSCSRDAELLALLLELMKKSDKNLPDKTVPEPF
jgi:hypothetical protein